MSLLSDLINLDLSDVTDKIIAEYIWIGGSGMDLRSKARTVSRPVSDPKKLPKWNYEADENEIIKYSELIIKYCGYG
ncbi:glutamine synthetase [Ranunculus cassubicifolius]